VDHHHLGWMKMIHRKHQNRYNQQWKSIYEIRKEQMYLVLVVVVAVVDMCIVE
jgi:hypothetical protein